MHAAGASFKSRDVSVGVLCLAARADDGDAGDYDDNDDADADADDADDADRHDDVMMMR